MLVLSESTPILTGFVGLLAALYLWSSRRSKATIAVPPGPKPIPILGNINDIPGKEPWLLATKLAKQYGDIVYMHFLGRGVVFLSSAEAASDLLDKRGSIYSDRPISVMGELCGATKMVPFMTYGDVSKRQRKLMHKALGSSAIPPYHPLLQTGTVAFLRKLIQTPSDYVEHSRWYAGGFTLSVVFGYEPAPHQDKFLTLASKWTDMFTSEILSGGAVWLVDLIPVLRHLPAWFPGTSFKRKAARCYIETEEFASTPFEFAKKSVESGIFEPSFCSTLMDDQEVTRELEYDIKWTSSSMYAGSADSTVATVSNFLLAMMEHPEILTRAREEIDRVVGTERLPSFQDREYLPYVDAVLSEIWRWAVPLPLNLPHCVQEDDIYRGMLIPKGSWVIANIWSMLRDEQIYPNPSQFDPERFMEKVDEETRRKRDPRNYIFGFGRRSCPGSNLVESSIWLLIVCMIATLDISKPKDEHGRVIEPNIQFNNELVRIPNPFKITIEPRSEQAANLIMEAEL